MPESGFPETFLEIGNDIDLSYNSLRTTRQSDGRLKIDIQGPGIYEHGLFLSVETGEILKLQILGFCGTTSVKTWAKVSFSHILEIEDENNAWEIEYHGCAPAKAGRIAIQLILNKRPNQSL